MRYFLGVDVGGTKTHALITDETGQVRGFGEGGPGNHEGVGYLGLAAAVRLAAGRAMVQAGVAMADIAGAGFGVGGYDWPSEREPTLRAIGALGLQAPLEVVNDALIGLLAGSPAGWGVAVVAGTGCNCWGWDPQRRVGRVTGMGWTMGEAAGAGELVGEAVRAVSRAWSRRGPATALSETLVALAGAKDTVDLLEGLTLGQYELDPEVARNIFRVADEGDPVADGVIAWAGRELGGLAVGVIRQLGFEQLDFDVVLVGSLHEGGPRLVEPMRQTIQAVAPGARLVRLSVPPVIGGTLLGMEQAGLRSEALREALIHSMEAWRPQPQRVQADT